MHRGRLQVLAGISLARVRVAHQPLSRLRPPAHRAQNIACDARTNKGPEAVVRRTIGNISGRDSRNGVDGGGQFCDGITAIVHSSGWCGSLSVEAVRTIRTAAVGPGATTVMWWAATVASNGHTLGAYEASLAKLECRKEPTTLLLPSIGGRVIDTLSSRSWKRCLR